MLQVEDEAEDSAIIRTRLRVRGRVQGVFYRASAADQAERLGLCGWVRNCRDDSVELEIEGPRARVLEMVRWCRQGPPAARVTRMETATVPVRGESGFRVRQSV